MTTGRPCTTPNQHAGAATLALTPSAATFGGYQAFVLTRHALHVVPTDRSLARKCELLTPVFTPALCSGRRILDLGANSAFFSFLALQNGASDATAVDMDLAHVEHVRSAAAALGYPQLTAVHGNVADWDEPADIVVALALVHWLYNCTAAFGSLSAVVERLASLAGDALIVEWVDPADPAIDFFGHLSWNAGPTSGPYDRVVFERELGRHFARVRTIGDVTPTRRLLLASKRRHDIDLRCPLPLRHPAGTVISSSLLTVHGGVEHWSRVYDLGDRVEKQATGKLAVREAAILGRLAAGAVPRVLDASESVDASTLTLEKIAGQPLSDALPALAASRASFRRFLAACVDLLAALRDAGIAHRDIHAENLLVRDGRPVLLDFGWATAPGSAIFTPDGFSPRMNSSDVQALGSLLVDACHPSWPERAVVGLMAHEDPAFRVDDPGILRELVAATGQVAIDAGEPAEPASADGLARSCAELLFHIERRDRQVSALRARQQLGEERSRSMAHALAEVELALGNAERNLGGLATPDEVADVIAGLIADPQPGRVDATPPMTAPVRGYVLASIVALRRHGQPGIALRLATALSNAVSPSDDLPEWLTAAYARASLCRELGRDDEALEGFAGILALAAGAPANVRGGACYHSAVILAARGEVDAACARLEECLAVLPGHAAAQSTLERLRRA
jgi:SAM-dependent methyltransferase/tetratricopeptide (TPR) repeat protein